MAAPPFGLILSERLCDVVENLVIFDFTLDSRPPRPSRTPRVH